MSAGSHGLAVAHRGEGAPGHQLGGRGAPRRPWASLVGQGCGREAPSWRETWCQGGFLETRESH